MQRMLMHPWSVVEPTNQDAAPAEPPAEAGILEALDVIDKLPDTLRSAAFALAEARLHVPRDRRCRTRRPRLAFRPVIERIDAAEGELAEAWLRLQRADLTPLLDRATQP